MHQCISIYPNKTQENTSSQIHEYIALAKLYGFNEVFTSIHLPEWSIEDQLNYGAHLLVEVGSFFYAITFIN